MYSLTNNIILRVVVALHVVFVILWLSLPVEWNRLLGAMFMTSMSLAAAAAWVPDAWEQIKIGKIDTNRITLIAVAITSLGVAGLGGFSFVFNTLGRPMWLIDLPVVMWLQLVIAFGQFLLTADPVKPKIKLASWNVWLLGSAALVLVLSGMIIGASLNVSDVMDDPFRNW